MITTSTPPPPQKKRKKKKYNVYYEKSHHISHGRIFLLPCCIKDVQKTFLWMKKFRESIALKPLYTKFW